MSKNFLLVHGAWQGAWVWNKIQPKLKAEGNTVKAIDLPGSGDDQTSVAAVSLMPMPVRLLMLPAYCPLRVK
ncbi:hypothetical protein [Pectobacterium odoriferum]|uniref:hypothetical protein n=1 Tax=Pectobacterium odoriferum TaxID=78398 RepID=UPI001C0EA7EF|nr:hypothetical protein [Pectobacterium odoriferum]